MDRPIQFAEHLQLTAVGIDPAAIGFATLTMESDRFIAVREEVNGAKQVAIIDLADANNVLRRPMSADSVIMHPEEYVIALRATGQLQVFDMAAKRRISASVFSEPVVFWTWLSATTLGIVTETSVYHWVAYAPPSAPDTVVGDHPIKVFDRHDSLAGNQIISYRATDNGQWLSLVGISANADPAGFRVRGAIQLYSTERRMSQAIEGHAAVFSKIRLEGATRDTSIFAFAARTSPTQAKLHLVEIDHAADQPVFSKKAVEVFFPAEAANDFPVALQASEEYGILYLVTKFGFIHLYDMETGTCLYMNRISGDTVFVTAPHKETGGLISVNRKGQVLSVSVDADILVPYMLQSLGNTDLAVRIAARPLSPLRTQATIDQIKQLPAAPGTLSPILQYFGLLLERGKLNADESLELARPVIAQGRHNLLEKWLKDDKLECTEALGDAVRYSDLTLALSVYLRAGASQKVVAAFAELGQWQKIIIYAKRVGYTPDYDSLVQHLARTNPDAAAEFATALLNDEAGPQVNVQRIADLLFAQNHVQAATAFLLDALKGDEPQHAHLQTRLLEANLLRAPQVADAILGNNMFSHYDIAVIAPLVEQAGLTQRSLELYAGLNDIPAIKRTLANAPPGSIPSDFLVDFFGRLSIDDSVALMDHLLATNIRAYLQTVVQSATKYSDLIGPPRLIALFEKYKSFEGLYYYLGSIVNLSESPDVHFTYIVAATRTGQIREVERMVLESNYYAPEKVKNFLMEAKLQDQLPLIIVCDRFNFVHDLVLYLVQNGLTNFIEVYVQRVNSTKTPQIIAGLLDVDADESLIKHILDTVTGPVDIDELAAEVEKRNNLKLILPFLERKAADHSPAEATPIYTALAMIYIESNKNPEQFLKENDEYDPLRVGKFSEKADPYLAYIAFAKGLNDAELLAVTNDNAMFKHQARYLVRRRSLDLWAHVLSPESQYRRALVEQIVGTAIPEATDAEDVSTTVKAFLQADMPLELIHLLEKIILEPSPFSSNQHLKKLLLLTTIRADPGKVTNLIEKLDGYDVDEIAGIAIDNGLNEEAFAMYRKHGLNLQAATILVENLVSLDRALQFAQKVNEPPVWSRVAQAQLDGLRVPDAIDSYIKAADPSNFAAVIAAAEETDKLPELIKYLQMARKSLREPAIDTELAFAYAKGGRVQDMQEFLQMTNVADKLLAGDKAFAAHLYEPARILFASVNNYARLATTLVCLGHYQEAVDAARKAGNTKVWRQVATACIDKKEFRLAQVCGLNVIVHAEELASLVQMYEYQGYIDEIIALLEAGLGLERAHMGMFTQLALLYTHYKADKLYDMLTLYWQRINISKVIKEVKEASLWKELVFLYTHFDEHDNAALTMIDHPVRAWSHSLFKDVVVKVANLEIYYKALSFYHEEQPLLLNDLLAALSPRIDHARVVNIFANLNDLPMIKPYLIATQRHNIPQVNAAYNSILIEEEDYKTLRDSIDSYDAYDAADLAFNLRDHDLLEFRRLAAHLYRKAGDHALAISLSKKDRLHKDAILTAADSKSQEVVHDLLQYFVDLGSHESYVATLYTCYAYIEPDVVQYISWRAHLNDYTMPYFLQVQRAQSLQLKALQEQVKALASKQPKEDYDGPILMGSDMRLIGNGQ